MAGITAIPRHHGADADAEGEGDGAGDDGEDGDETSRAIGPYAGRARNRHEAAVWAIAIAGLRMSATAAPPTPIRLLLLPLYASEAALRSLAAKSTKGELASAVGKRWKGNSE